MALILQFFHLVRLSIMPAIYYKIKQVQTSAPKHGHDEGEAAGGAEGGHWTTDISTKYDQSTITSHHYHQHHLFIHPQSLTHSQTNPAFSLKIMRIQPKLNR